MLQREVVVTREAEDDLAGIFDWIEGRASSRAAAEFVDRLTTFIEGLAIGSRRGTIREPHDRNVRMIGFERRTNVVFRVTDEKVLVIRILHGGQDWRAALAGDEDQD